MDKRITIVDIILAVLSLMPILGLIFFFIWRNSNPTRAKLCGFVALVAFVAGLIGSFTNWFGFY